MGMILTKDKAENERCMGEINAILKKYHRIMSPKLTMTTGGISFTIEVIRIEDNQVVPAPPGEGGLADA